MISIREILENIKRAPFGGWFRDALLASAVLLTGLVSFGLGRLSAVEERRPAVSILEAPAAEIRPMHAGGEVVGSRSGSAYYFPWCGGAERIAPGNRVWFPDQDAAEQAGYRPAKNCKGLE